ncbi:MAG: hypothetical protein JSR59_02365 [Proteobacteria bacterium]|nr:hypothetical protein [Pseudomonadota bacterium]
MLRNLNLLRDAKRICGSPQVGVLGSSVPTGGLVYADVQARGLQTRQVRFWVQSTTIASGSLFVFEDTTWSATGVPAGNYSASGRLFVDDVDQGAVSYPFSVGTSGSAPMLRNLNLVRDAKRICGNPRVGVPVSAVPTIGPPYALLFNDIQTYGYATNLLRVWIEQSSFPAGALFVYEDSSYLFGGSPIPDGIHAAQGRVFVDDVDQGTALFQVTVG